MPRPSPGRCRAVGWVGSAVLLGFVVLAPAIAPSSAASATRQDDPLPVIVTYELQHRQLAARSMQSDPKGFWTNQILTQIEAKRSTPPSRLETTVTVQIVFTVARDGHLVHSAVDKSSGLPDVDAIATGMVAHADPFPPMPQQLADSEITFVLPVRFR